MSQEYVNNQSSHQATKSIGKIILAKFLEGESIEELAEDYRVNCLMVEEIIRCEINGFNDEER